MGLFQIYGAMNGQKVEKAVKEIGLLLKELRQQGITEEELFCAKERVKSDLLIGLDSTENRMAQNGKSLLLSGQLETMPDLLQRTLQVSKEDVMRYIKQYIQLEKTSLVLVGNGTKRNDQILKSIWSHGYRE